MIDTLMDRLADGLEKQYPGQVERNVNGVAVTLTLPAKSAAGSKATRAGPISADRLKSFIERIEKLDEERRAIGSDIKDVYSEAKGVGYDVKTMRKVIALRRMDPADRAEAETLLDVYKHALGMI